eukprot:254727-Prymnesium_polylepis.1
MPNTHQAGDVRPAVVTAVTPARGRERSPGALAPIPYVIPGRRARKQVPNRAPTNGLWPMAEKPGVDLFNAPGAA